jgi:XRE family transcriptional regulator, regulator of sulfur utilization
MAVDTSSGPSGSSDPSDSAPLNLARNLRALREAQGLTQNQLAERAGVPRATLAHLETGGGNPTLLVTIRIASALNVTIEELIGPPRATGRLYHAEQLPVRTRAGVTLHKLLPDPLPGIDLERMHLPARAVMKGVPHSAGTREYLFCERGRIELVASGATYQLGPGDVVVFRGDQKHSYRALGDDDAVAFAVVLLPPTGG